MNCRHVAQRLSSHLEGLLPAREAATVRAHLEACPACRRLRDEFVAMRAELRELAEPLPPPGLRRQAVQQWIAERETPGRPWAGWSAAPSAMPSTWRAATAVSMLLLALLGSAFVRWDRQRAEGPPIPTSATRQPAGKTPAGPRLALARPQAMLPAVKPWERRRLAGIRSTARPTQTPGSSGRSMPAGRRRSQHPALPTFSAWDTAIYPRRGDLASPSGRSGPETRLSRSTSTDDWEQIEDQVRRAIRVRDDFVRVPFPRVASIADRSIAEAVESYKQEAAVVDLRLSREVTLHQKATALSDLCDQLRSDTGIQLSAGPSVADEKVTLFCEKQPLRDVMRQLSRPFGYTWLRSGKQGEYKYELVQDLRSQLLEEELRNRDRDAALIALEKDLEQYRPFLDLSPDEALARAKTASPADKPLLEDLAGTAWGPLHLYFRLSSQEQAALRAGQELKFSEAPRPGEKPRPEMGGEVLPPEIARGVLQSVRFLRLIKTDEGWEYSPGDSPPAALPPAAIPEARAWVLLGLGPSDLSQFTFKATDGVFTIGPDGGVHLHASFGGGGRGRSSAHQKTNNAAANAALAHDPALGARVTVVPVASSPWAVVNEGPDRPLPGDKKVNSAEVLEALHQATGIPIVADFYTRLFKRDAVSVRNQPLFEALNKLGDAMRVRWHKEGGWLQLRSLTFFDDRRKEVPNRLLSRWAESRRLHGALSLDDLVEIAQLPDAQLDAAELAEGAREWWGLAEWDLACSTTVRPHLRYLARLTPEQRRETMSATGLPFTGMSLAQQQQFMVFGLGDAPLRSLDELAGATLRVEYTQPGQFQWGEPGWSGYYTRWVIPLGPGPQDHRALRPPVTARTRQETLAAVRRVDPQLREALLQAVDRADPRTPQALDAFEEQQIFPTQRNLTFVYIPGATNARSIFVLSAADGLSGRPNYRLR